MHPDSSPFPSSLSRRLTNNARLAGIKPHHDILRRWVGTSHNWISRTNLACRHHAIESRDLRSDWHSHHRADLKSEYYSPPRSTQRRIAIHRQEHEVGLRLVILHPSHFNKGQSLDICLIPVPDYPDLCPFFNLFWHLFLKDTRRLIILHCHESYSRFTF